MQHKNVTSKGSDGRNVIHLHCNSGQQRLVVWRPTKLWRQGCRLRQSLLVRGDRSFY